MHKFYDNLSANMDAVTEKLTAWAEQFSDITDANAFSIDIERHLRSFVRSIAAYEAIRSRSKSHAARNHYQELDAAIDSIYAVLNTVFEVDQNLLYEDEVAKSEAQKHQRSLTSVLIFLLEKQVSIGRAVQAEQRSALELLKKHALVLGGSLVEKEFIRAAEEFMAALEIENLYRERTKNRSQIRETFVTNVARVYLEHSGRKNLKRSVIEISDKTKNPFYELLQLCFSLAFEQVNSAAIAKLVTKASNRAKT